MGKIWATWGSIVFYYLLAVVMVVLAVAISKSGLEGIPRHMRGHLRYSYPTLPGYPTLRVFI